MSLVFAAIAPHGTLPEAPVPDAEKTHDALAELGRRFDATSPEATIVLSPHNVHVEGLFAVVLAGMLSGSLAEFDAPEVKLSSPVDLELATQAIVALHDDGIPVVGASFGANDPGAATAPMDWGVLIPQTGSWAAARSPRCRRWWSARHETARSRSTSGRAEPSPARQQDPASGSP